MHTATDARHGTIPARAGQPRSRRAPLALSGDYPRSRGATGRIVLHLVCMVGLSPLARGNPRIRSAICSPAGTIPARAGQPYAGRPSEWDFGDYPRSRGATGPDRRSVAGQGGLSPLARGNLGMVGDSRPGRGTIPARAGQPPRVWPISPVSGDYPRSRGATSSAKNQMGTARGLSPLARGNLESIGGKCLRVGTIPARAGQPTSTRSHTTHSGDYPRSRGATLDWQSPVFLDYGLSPLARGNLHLRHCVHDPDGTIPARAGQPDPRATRER